jgi:hypothetical protein
MFMVQTRESPPRCSPLSLFPSIRVDMWGTGQISLGTWASGAAGAEPCLLLFFLLLVQVKHNPIFFSDFWTGSRGVICSRAECRWQIHCEGRWRKVRGCRLCLTISPTMIRTTYEFPFI